jgi:D-inositol-3-phosphate glycosyltransferase
VADGSSGVLVDGHDPGHWSAVLEALVRDGDRRARLASGARAHARRFSWTATADGLVDGYARAARTHAARSSAGRLRVPA